MRFPYYDYPYAPDGIQRKFFTVDCSVTLLNATLASTGEQMTDIPITIATPLISEEEPIDHDNLEKSIKDDRDYFIYSYHFGEHKSLEDVMKSPNVIKQIENSNLILPDTKAMIVSNLFLPQGRESYGWSVLLYDGNLEYIIPFNDYRYINENTSRESLEQSDKYINDNGTEYDIYLKGETLYEVNDKFLNKLIYYIYG